MSVPTATFPCFHAWAFAAAEAAFSQSAAVAPPWRKPTTWVLPRTGMVKTAFSGDTHTAGIEALRQGVSHRAWFLFGWQRGRLHCFGVFGSIGPIVFFSHGGYSSAALGWGSERKTSCHRRPLNGVPRLLCPTRGVLYRGWRAAHQRGVRLCIHAGELLDTEKPDRIAVAFDSSRESFRTEIYPEYKGTRDSLPPEFEGQVQLIEAVLDKMGVKTITVPDFEADDVLATLATEGKARGMDVLIASGDRDTFQLVNDKVTVLLYPGRLTSDLNDMTPEAVEAKYAVTPARYPELAALVGETSDNLPGYPRCGA